MTVANSGMTLYQDMDTDTNWAGDDGSSAEEFQQGNASQQWIVAKNGNETATLTLSANMTGAKYLMIPFISTISPFYTSVTATLGDGTNTDVFTMADQLGGLLHRAVAGQWEFNNHMLQFSGSLTLSSFASVAINVDNSSSGNIRSVLNHYVDAIYYGTGRVIGGTTVGDKLFKESNDLNISGDVFDGCTLEFSGGIDAQTDIEITTTLGNSYGEALTFREVPNTNNVYTLLISGTADFQATAIAAATANVTVNFDSSTATSFSKAGGNLVGAGTTAFKLSQNIKGVVFTSRTSIAHNGCNFENNTVNTSGSLTITAGGSCTNNTFNQPSATAIITSDLALNNGNTFNSDGSNHAVELTSIGGGSMIWDNTLTSYDSGSTGSPVTPTSTGNEALFVNVGAGEITVNIADGASVPSIRSAGATVNVVAGLVVLTVETQDGNEVRFKQGSFTLQHTQNVTGGNVTYSYTYVAGTKIKVSVGGAGFVRDTISLELSSSNATLVATLNPDPSYLT